MCLDQGSYGSVKVIENLEMQENVREICGKITNVGNIWKNPGYRSIIQLVDWLVDEFRDCNVGLIRLF